MKKTILALSAAFFTLLGCTTPGGGYSFPVSNASVEVTTNEADGIGESGATLHGRVSIEDATAKQANVWFVLATSEKGLSGMTAAKVGSQNVDLTDGAYTGDFEADATKLKADTQYFFQAVAYVDGKTVKGDAKSFTTDGSGQGGGGGGEGGGEGGGGQTGQISIKTGGAANVKENSADLSGTITIPSGMETPAFGIMYAAGENPTSSNATKIPATQLESNGSFTVKAANLTPGTLYYFKAYFTESGVDKVGSVANFTTPTPSVEAQAASNISNYAGTINGKLTVIATDLNPEVWFMVGNDASNLGTKINPATAPGTDGSFQANLSNLDFGTTYYYKAMAKILDKEYSSEVKSFSPKGPQFSAVTGNAENITPTTADIKAQLSVTTPLEGSHTVITKMVFAAKSFSLNGGIPDDDALTVYNLSNPDSNGNFVLNISSLTPGTTYYYAAVMYYEDYPARTFTAGQVRSFTTKVDIYAVTTEAASSITSNSAVLNGSFRTNVPLASGRVPTAFFGYAQGDHSAVNDLRDKFESNPDSLTPDEMAILLGFYQDAAAQQLLVTNIGSPSYNSSTGEWTYTWSMTLSGLSPATTYSYHTVFFYNSNETSYNGRIEVFSTQ